MATVQEALDQTLSINGAVGAALVDYESGMTLGTIGGGKIDMELAGAGNTEVVRTKRQIIDRLGLDERIEDILITLNDQYNLIRIFHENDSIFTYLVLDKEKTNLALARMELKKIDGTLQI